MKKQTLLMISLATLLAAATQAGQEQLAKASGRPSVETTRPPSQLKATLSRSLR